MHEPVTTLIAREDRTCIWCHAPVTTTRRSRLAPGAWFHHVCARATAERLGIPGRVLHHAASTILQDGGLRLPKNRPSDDVLERVRGELQPEHNDPRRRLTT